MSSANPFFSPEDEIDDDTFVNSGTNNYGQSAESRLYEQKRQQILEQRREIENRTVNSSTNAVRALFEAEQAGISAADDLCRQREQLTKVDRNLDDINNTMKGTQRHLTAMKSVFSGIKSYFGRSNTVDNSTKPVTSPTSPTEDPANQTALARTLNDVRGASETARYNNHPTLVNRGLSDTSGFGADFDDDKPSHASSFSSQVDKRLNDNLSELSSGLGRLKNLAQGLGSELDEQNELLNNINDKVENAEGTIKWQNKQMNRLLNK